MESIFHKAVARIFESWTALQVAMEEGCDGAATKEKYDWLVGALEGWMNQNKNADQRDVEETLADVLFTEFNLIVEDESLEQVSKDILECFTLCREGKNISKFYSLPKLPADQLVQPKSGAEDSSSSENDDDDDDDDDEEDVQNPVPQLVPVARQAPQASRQAAQSLQSSANLNRGRGSAPGVTNTATQSDGSSPMETEDGAQAEMDENDEWTTVVRHRKR